MKHGEQLAPLIAAGLERAGHRPPRPHRDRGGRRPRPVHRPARRPGHRPHPGHGPRDPGVRRVLARRAGRSRRPPTLGTPTSLVATDARRKEVYLASYDADGSRVEGPVVEKPARGRQRPARSSARAARSTPRRSRTPRGPLRPSAGWLAHAVAEELAELLDPEPLYLRRPDAETPGAPQAGLVTSAPATLADLDAVADLEVDNLGVDAWSAGPDRARRSPASTPSLHVPGSPRTTTGAVVGHAVAAGRRHRPSSSASRSPPPTRRTGLATALLAEVLRTAEQAGVERVLLEVREDNAGALAFYAAHGFAELDRRRALLPRRHHRGRAAAPLS